MVYVRDWGRPFGVEPKVFKTLDEATKAGCEYTAPSIMEFETEFQAWRWMKEHAPESYAERRRYSQFTGDTVLVRSGD